MNKGITLAEWSEKIEKFLSRMGNVKYQEKLVEGLYNTISIAVAGLIIGIIIGSLIAIVRVAPKYRLIFRVLDKICSIYVAIFRGTPIVVQLLLTYYVILPAIGVKGIGNIIVGMAVFGMNSGAYVSEIMRGGLNSVDRGQMEGGRAVGLSYGATMVKIIIPQAIKNILPTLGNEFITLIKETAVLSVITIPDLYSVLIDDIAANSYEWMVPSIVIAIIYIILVLIITILIKVIEGIFAKSDKSKMNNKKVNNKKVKAV